MIAAQTFNEPSNNEVPAIYGTVTTGTNWRFLKLEGSIISIDLSEYYQDLRNCHNTRLVRDTKNIITTFKISLGVTAPYK